MAMQARNRPERGNPLSQGTVQRSTVAMAMYAKTALDAVYIVEDNLVNLGQFSANTSCYVDIPVGRYVYRQFGISLWAQANIPGVSVNRDGKEIVNSANLTTYIDTITLEINGKAEWEMTADELRRWNDYQNLATTEGMLRIPFGAPNQFHDDSAEDAYQLGTMGLRSVRLRIKTKAAWVAGMLPIVMTEYVRTNRPLVYLQRTVRHAFSNPSIGRYTVSDLPVGKDWSAIWVMTPTATLQRAKLVIDDDIVVDADTWQIRGAHEAMGRDVAALGTGLLIDSFRDGDAIGFDSVSDTVAERRRGADVRLELTMTAANVAMTAIVFQCGLFDQA